MKRKERLSDNSPVFISLPAVAGIKSMLLLIAGKLVLYIT